MLRRDWQGTVSRRTRPEKGPGSGSRKTNSASPWISRRDSLDWCVVALTPRMSGASLKFRESFEKGQDRPVQGSAPRHNRIKKEKSRNQREVAASDGEDDGSGEISKPVFRGLVTHTSGTRSCLLLSR